MAGDNTQKGKLCVCVYVCTNLFDVVRIDLAGGVLGCDGEAGIIEPRVIDKRHPGRAVVISHDLRVVSKSRRCHLLCSHSLPSSEMLAVLYRSAAGILTNVHKRKPWMLELHLYRVQDQEASLGKPINPYRTSQFCAPRKMTKPTIITSVSLYPINHRRIQIRGVFAVLHGKMESKIAEMARGSRNTPRPGGPSANPRRSQAPIA